MAQDIEMPDADADAGADATASDSVDRPLLLSEAEERVLELYDRLQELQLLVATLRAQQSYKPTSSGEVTAQDIRDAQDQLLDARAAYVLRNAAVENVMAVNPILRAVHASTQASPIERDLLPQVEERDAASIAAAKQSGELRGILDRLADTEAEGIRLGRRNADLAAQVISLAEEASRAREGAFDTPRARQQLAALEQELKHSRQRWKTIKGAASGIVAGSGVDWVRDPELRDVVLDPE